MSKPLNTGKVDPDLQVKLAEAQGLVRVLLLLASLQSQQLEDFRSQKENLTNKEFSIESRAEMLERREKAHEHRAHLLDLRQERLDKIRNTESA